MREGERLQDSCLFAAQAFRHNGFAPDPLLSVKCMFNGTATYRIQRQSFAVDETGYLFLNEGQAYEIEINSPTRIESFVVYFPRGWSDDVLRNVMNCDARLLDEPDSAPADSVHFFETFMHHDDIVSPALATLRKAHKTGHVSDLWLEQKLRGLLARMLRVQRQHLRAIEGVKALRASTREELWRRLHCARDFIRAHFHANITISEIARSASLSPFHFMRAFKGMFHMTPHEYISRCRVERAKFLLARTSMPVTRICFEVGFESLGTFSSWFSRLTGMSPRQHRTKKAGSEK